MPASIITHTRVVAIFSSLWISSRTYGFFVLKLRITSLIEVIPKDTFLIDCSCI